MTHPAVPRPPVPAASARAAAPESGAGAGVFRGREPARPPNGRQHQRRASPGGPPSARVGALPLPHALRHQRRPSNQTRAVPHPAPFLRPRKDDDAAPAACVRAGPPRPHVGRSIHVAAGPQALAPALVLTRPPLRQPPLRPRSDPTDPARPPTAAPARVEVRGARAREEWANPALPQVASSHGACVWGGLASAVMGPPQPGPRK